MRTRDLSWSCRHSSRIMHLLECMFFLEHCTALRWRVADECLKHSYYTRVGLSFSRLFYINYIVFVVRSLIWCLVWMQVHWSEKSSCWKQVLEQWGSEQGSDCHVATSPRRDVATSRRQLEICTLSFKVRMVQKGGESRGYERRHGIPE